MAKNQKTQKPKAAKEEIEVKEPVQNPNEGQKDDAGSTIHNDATGSSGKEKESLKSTENEHTGMTFAEAEAEMDKGIVVKLPEWDGFWFKKIGEDPIYVLTKEGEILDTPWEESKQRNDWQVAEANEEQSKLLDKFWDEFNQAKTDAENRKILDDNNSLKAKFYSRAEGGSFVKIKGNLTVEDLTKRKNLPADSSQSSEFILENGRVFSLRENRVTNQDLSKQLSILNKQKSK